MTQVVAILTAVLLQAPPKPPDGVPFEGTGTPIFATSVDGVRPLAADKERAFEGESPRIKRWLRIPAALDKDLQVGVYCWLKGIEKDGILEPTEAIVLPAESFLGLFKAPKPEKFIVRFGELNGGCNHMPVIRAGVTCRPSFSGSIELQNNRAEAVTVAVEHLFWTNKLDELGKTTDRIQVRLKPEAGLEPLPAKIEAGAKRTLVLDFPMKPGECLAVRSNLTLFLKINGERVFIRGVGKFTVSM
jgi:hypothetical protein